MNERDLALDRIDRWRRRASVLPGHSVSTSVADNIRAGARLRDDIFERGLGAGRRALRDFQSGRLAQLRSAGRSDDPATD